MRWLPLVLFSASLATAQDQIAVSNAASLIGTTTVAPGSMISIELIPQLDEPVVPIDPASLNVTIRPNGSNLAEECGSVPASVNFGQFVNPFQVIAVLPSTLPLGPAQLSLYHSGLTAVAQISVVPSSLGLFPPSATHTVQQMGSDQVLRANQLTHPAQPGDTVTLWGTGLGSATQVTVLVGGIATTSSFAGPAPYMPGVDEVQFVVPDDPTIPNDCYVAVQAQTSAATTNTISIAKTRDGSACQSSLGLTAADLASLDAGGTVGLAQLTLSAEAGAPVLRIGNFLLVAGTGSASGFARTESANFTAMGQNAAGVAQISGPMVADDVFFGCSNPAPGLATAAISAAFGSTYHFGNKVTLQGAGGTLDLTALFGGLPFTGLHTGSTVTDLSQLPPPLFTPGTWVFSGKGGMSSQGSTGTAPFSVRLTLPPEIMATNLSALQTINRQQNLVVTWDPTGYGDQDVWTATVSEVSLPLANSGTLPAVLQFTSSENWPVTVE